MIERIDLKGTCAMREKKPCTCGKEADFVIGTRTFSVSDKEILIHKLPHFHCHFCGSVWYEADIPISTLLKQAYQEQVYEITFTE